MKNDLHLLLSSKRKFWFYNINQEQQWNESSYFPSMTDIIGNQIVAQQEQQMIFIADPNDVLLFRHNPSQEFIDYLSSNDIMMPNIKKITDEFDIPWLDMNNDDIFVPYIINDFLFENLSNHSIEYFGPTPGITKDLNNKIWVREVAETLGMPTTKGYICKNFEELNQAYDNLVNQSFYKFVIKIPFGSSGKGLKTFSTFDEFLALARYIRRRSEKFEVILEGWHPIKYSLNSQLHIENNSVKILSITEQEINTNGVYLGTNYTPHYPSNIISQYENYLLRLGEFLLENKYTGTLGVDSIVDSDETLIPIIEINARFTQVTYLLRLVRKLQYKFSFIRTRYINIQSKESIPFNYFLDDLNTLLEVDNEHNFLLYTFASQYNDLDNMYRYRVYCLFYGTTEEKVQTMMDSFIAIQNEM